MLTVILVKICIYKLDTSANGIATCYGQDHPGIESSEDEISRICPYRPRGPPNLDSCPVGTRSVPGSKMARRGVDHPPQSSADVEERVKTYIYSLSGHS
jgi:hypothetical protein